MKQIIFVIIFVSCVSALCAQSADSVKLPSSMNPNADLISTDNLSRLNVVVVGKQKYYLEKGGINQLNPAWIEKITVYGGKDATDRFGKRGENGVVQFKLDKNIKLLVSFSKKLERIKGS
jgi:hypothetical protein